MLALFGTGRRLGFRVVTRYLEVGTEIARRVRSGALPVGAELPAVRECAREFDTTSTTVARAYRLLADGGVITMADRRRARVATSGAVAAARLLEPDRVFRLAGSDDPALQLLLDHVGPSVVGVGTRGSFAALRALGRGDADGAAIHLRHLSGVFNAPFAVALLRDRDPHLLRLWRREQGFLVAPGNPRGVHAAADLAGLRVARRETGAGTRVLLDQLLTGAGTAPESVAGPELPSHLETGLAVAAGLADAALGLRSAAADLALEFVPVTWESYDIALGATALGAAQPIVDALHDPSVVGAVAELGGYDLRDAGTVQRLAGGTSAQRP